MTSANQQFIMSVAPFSRTQSLRPSRLALRSARAMPACSSRMNAARARMNIIGLGLAALEHGVCLAFLMHAA